MMFANAVNFEKEFIERTKANLDGYCRSGGKFEVTQFVNSMLGLLIIPKEKYYSLIENNMISEELFRKIKKCCHSYEGSKLTLRYIIRKIRNAASHGHLVFEVEEDSYGNPGTQIARITFEDYSAEVPCRKNFVARIEIDLLKEFVLAFADSILKLS